MKKHFEEPSVEVISLLALEAITGSDDTDTGDFDYSGGAEEW